MKAVKGSPAEIAGLSAGDRVIAINSKSTRGMTIEDAVNNIKGPIGTSIAIEVKKASTGEMEKYNIMRGSIKTAPEDTFEIERGGKKEIYITLGQPKVASSQSLDDETISELITLINDSDSKKAENAIRELGKYRIEKAVQPLAKAFSTSTDRDRLNYIAYALGQINTKESLEIIRKFLKDKDSTRREMATWGLAACHGADAEEMLKQLLRDPEVKMREAAIFRLKWKVGDNTFVGPLDESYIGLLTESLNDESTQVRLGAIELLSRFKTPGVIEAILKKIKDNDENVRSSVIQTLTPIGSNEIIGPFIKTLDDESIHVQIAAAIGLNKFKENAKVEGALLEKLKTTSLKDDLINENFTMVIIRSLSGHKSDKTKKAFEALLSHKSEQIRKRAKLALEGKIIY